MIWLARFARQPDHMLTHVGVGLAIQQGRVGGLTMH